MYFDINEPDINPMYRTEQYPEEVPHGTGEEVCHVRCQDVPPVNLNTCHLDVITDTEGPGCELEQTFAISHYLLREGDNGQVGVLQVGFSYSCGRWGLLPGRQI